MDGDWISSRILLWVVFTAFFQIWRMKLKRLGWLGLGQLRSHNSSGPRQDSNVSQRSAMLIVVHPRVMSRCKLINTYIYIYFIRILGFRGIRIYTVYYDNNLVVLQRSPSYLQYASGKWVMYVGLPVHTVAWQWVACQWREGQRMARGGSVHSCDLTWHHLH